MGKQGAGEVFFFKLSTGKLPRLAQKMVETKVKENGQTEE